MSFPLVGNLSDTPIFMKTPEEFRTSQNDSTQAINVILLMHSSTQKVQLTAGMCAAKASRHVPGHLCGRLHDPDNVQVYILSVEILYRRKSCVQEVLLHMCLPSFSSNCTFQVNKTGYLLHRCHYRTNFIGTYLIPFFSFSASSIINPKDS
jgi:hypothetical protein